MRATIFVTDDDDVVRAAITRRLSRGGIHEVRNFDSGEALLEALDHDIPDIVLLDLKMTARSIIFSNSRIFPG